MSRPCEHMTDRGSFTDPPAYCDEDALDGEEFCSQHLPDEPDPDAAAKARREQ